jgi:hypothetical protein
VIRWLNAFYDAHTGGNSGAGGSTCGGASANVNPIFQFDTSGKLLKTFGAGMFVSPHKLAVDRDAGTRSSSSPRTERSC